MILAINVFLLLAATSTAMAGPLGAAFRHINRGYHRNQCWPQPFAYQDYQAAKAPFALMVNNGWRLQNVIGTHHYIPGSATLNEAGQRQIHWIITQAPQNRRTIFVEQGETRQQTEARLAAVRKIAEHLAVNGEGFDVQETHLPAQGTSGAYADRVNQGFGESIPPPRIPTTSGSFGAGTN